MKLTERSVKPGSPAVTNLTRSSGACWSLDRRRIRAVTFALALLPVTGLRADDVEAIRWTVDGGGEMLCAAGPFELSGTIGQPDAGTLTGGGFELNGGFWLRAASADCNVDGGVDLLDYGALRACATGPGGGISAVCVCSDLDRDEDIDLADIAGFQRVFTGD